MLCNIVVQTLVTPATYRNLRLNLHLLLEIFDVGKPLSTRLAWTVKRNGEGSRHRHSHQSVWTHRTNSSRNLPPHIPAEENLFWMDALQTRNLSEFFEGRDDWWSTRRTCPKSAMFFHLIRQPQQVSKRSDIWPQNSEFVTRKSCAFPLPKDSLREHVWAYLSFIPLCSFENTGHRFYWSQFISVRLHTDPWIPTKRQQVVNDLQCDMHK